MPAISLKNSKGITITGGHISGSDVGIEAENSDFTVQGMTFDNVRRPFDVRGGASANVQGNRVLNDPITRGERSGVTTSAWRRNGPPMPSQCPHCKSIFPSRTYDFGTAKFYSRDNEETCRECGLDGAKVADGLFDLTEEAARVISGPDLTYAMLAAISKAASDRATESIGDEEFISRLNGIDARLGEIARKISAGGSNAIAWFGIALSIMGNVLAYFGLVEAQKATPATIEATVIAREALQIQKAPNPSEELLKFAVGQLSELKIVLTEQLNRRIQVDTKQPSAGESKAEPPAETGSIYRKAQSKPKGRRVHRHSGPRHRYVLHCRCRPTLTQY